MSNPINDRIRTTRKAKRLKQYQVAQFLGIKESTYSQMERTGNVTSDRIVQLAEIFGVTTDYLLTGKDSDELSFAPPEQTTSIVREKAFYEQDNRLELTPNEISIITILRNFPKDVREDVINYIEEKYHNC